MSSMKDESEIFSEFTFIKKHSNIFYVLCYIFYNVNYDEKFPGNLFQNYQYFLCAHSCLKII